MCIMQEMSFVRLFLRESAESDHRTNHQVLINSPGFLALTALGGGVLPMRLFHQHNGVEADYF